MADIHPAHDEHDIAGSAFLDNPDDIRDLRSACIECLHDLSTAKIALREINFPAARLPADPGSIKIFWHLVFDELETGIMNHDQAYRRILDELVHDYRAHHIVHRLNKKYPKPRVLSPTTETLTREEGSGATPNRGRERGRLGWRRTAVAGVLVLALFGGLLIVLALRDGKGSSCTAPKHSASHLERRDGECIGYSDGAYVFGEYGNDHTDRSVDDLVAVQHLIRRQNTCAETLRRHSQQSNRPFVTLIYFAGLSSSSNEGGNWAAAQVSELEGLLIWQRHQNIVTHNPPDSSCRPAPPDTSKASSPSYLGEDTEQSGPIVRVIVANGGSEMRSADVVGRLLVRFASNSVENVGAVIGLDRTIPQTKQAIGDLGRARILTIATTLSGDDLTALSPSYFQLVPQNTRQAQVVTRYAAWTQRRQIDIYFPNQDCSGSNIPPTKDDYIQSLVFDTQAAARASDVRGQPLEVSPHGWLARTCQGKGDLQGYFAAECSRLGSNGGGRDHLVYYAGRHADFGDFSTGMAGCLDTVDGPSSNGVLVLGDDAVVRNFTQLGGSGTRHVIFRFISKGPAPTLAGESCANGKLAGIMAAGKFPFKLDSDLPEMCTRLNAMFSYITDTASSPAEPAAPGSTSAPVLRRPVTQRWVDERLALAYDAAKLTLNAVCRTSMDLNASCQPEGTDRIDTRAVQNWIQHAPQSGTTGTVNFATNHAADGKQLAILRVDLGRQALPDARWPPPSVTELEDDPQSTCKFVLRGIPPEATDCLGNALIPASR
ncbi:hypothetical protein MXD59_13860 [Frankia sp. Ag45/Mut15]|uniref:Uncharacterized protein n=1 Tax=Frankia umida TaxID=573489 RepID=A0ABT0JZ86_9ACTN|nr:hypothetical protein [Frankia umida]MCK9876853.1 hypothetical protein [Frankia umida]